MVAIALLVLAVARDHAQGQQPSIAVITVVDSGARYPLVNADVIDLSTGEHRLTDERGQARFTWPNDGRMRLRVRQVGYQPLQRTLRLPDSSKTATTFAMNKIAYVISPVSSTSHCASAADSASLNASMSELEQLRQAAEKYDQFRRLFPFEATIERRTAVVPTNGVVKRITAVKEKFRSENWQEPYKPGDIIQYERGDFTVPLLFLSTLGDSVFWENHCFIARGVESYQGVRVVRLEFSPSSDVTGPDYAGAAFLDSATSSLLKVDFHLSNLHQRYGPTRLEGYMTFMSPTPFVMMPDTTAAIWWVRKVSGSEWGYPDFVQRLNLEGLKYRKERPPAH